MVADLNAAEGVNRTTVQDLLSFLRSALGEEKERLQAVRKAPDGTYFKRARYVLDLQGVALDVHEYQAVAESARKATAGLSEDLQTASSSLPEDFDADLDGWLEALQSFPVNPGLDSGVFPEANAAYRRYGELKDGLIEAIAVGLAVRYLRDGDELWLTQAQNHLDNIGDGLTEGAWHLRFRLAGSMSRWKDGLNDLVAKYETVTREELNGDLATLVGQLRGQDPTAVLVRRLDAEGVVAPAEQPSTGAAGPESALTGDGVAGRSKDSAEGLVGAGHAFEGALAGLGITHAKELHLKDARLSPVECSRRVIRRLWFSGVMANKWVESEDRYGDHPYEEFDKLLTRLDTEADGETLARLMIVNPWGPKADVLRNRGMLTEQEMNSIPILRDLVARHPSFEVRMYDTMPLFRMIIVDDQFVTVGPYLNRAEVLPNRGWEVPQLVLSPRADFPMSQAFVGMFEEAWHRNRTNPLPFA